MDRREFQLVEGTAKKFWAIKLDGKSFVVHYGRIGTAGQAQEKTFPTEDAAKIEYNKLIAEKTKKGYAEVAGGATGAAGATPAPIAKAKPAPKPVPAEATDEPVEAAAAIEPVKEPAIAAPKPAPTPVAPVTIERRVHLKDEDWMRFTWKHLPPFRKLEPRPFDFSALMEEIKGKVNNYGTIYLHHLEVPDCVSAAEATFWLTVYTQLVDKRMYSYAIQLADLEQRADELKPKNIPTADEVRAQLKAARNAGMDVYTGAPQILLPFLGPVKVASSFLELVNHLATAAPNAVQVHYLRFYMAFNAISAFSKHILPQMNEEERGQLREMLEKAYDAEQDPTANSALCIISFLSIIGGGQRLVAHVAHQADKTWTNRWNSPGNIDVLAGLPDEATFVAETRRLVGKLSSPSDVRLWLAATEWRELDLVTNAIKAAGSKDDATALAKLLALVEAPEAAVPMLETQIDSKAPVVGVDWLAAHPHLAVIGLTPAAMGQGKIAEAAREHLHTMRRNGLSPLLAAAIPHLAPAEGAWLQREIIDVKDETIPELSAAELPEPLRSAFAFVKVSRLPAWLNFSSLPPIRIAGKKLGTAEVKALIETVKATPPGTAAPLFALMKEHAERISLDLFAWKVFEQWNNLGAPSKDKWAMSAISHLGGDGCVLKLTPLVRAWPGESQHKRAVNGLECLRAVGTDTALMALNGIAQKLKFKALKEKAQALMEEIAAARGFTREQLADRIVPDCGLDDNGSRVFDFGPRKFKFVLGSEMKPLVRDEAGKVRPDLPSPNSSDDAAKAEAAVAEWKLLKKTLREVLKVQAERLEDAMITGRRWTPEEFEKLLVKHPLMINLVRQLVFASYDAGDKITHTFRGTEDQTLADQNDEEIALPTTGQIGIVHPAHLDDATKGAWGQILSDYEIIPPFQQLGRPICRPEAEDLEKTEITRYRGAKIPGIVVYGILERNHWSRDTPADGGGFMQHSKFFPSANLTAFIKYTGMSIGYYEEPQEIEEVYFVPGHIKPDWWGTHKNRAKMKDVDPVVMSEVLRLANAIHSKAE